MKIISNSNLSVLFAACAVAMLWGCKKDDGKLDETKTYAVMATSDGNGAVEAKPSKAVAGTTIELTANPDEGWLFEKWTVLDGDITFEDASANPASFTMPAGDVAVRADFIEAPPEIYTVTVTSEGSGTTGADPDSAPEGTVVTLTAYPGEGWLFEKWTVLDGGIAFEDASANPASFTMPAGNVAVRADFIEAPPETYTVSVTTGDNGSATVSHDKAAEGTTVTITPKPHTGYAVETLTVTPNNVNLTKDASGSITFTMPAADVRISMKFGIGKGIFSMIPDAIFRDYCRQFDTDGNGDLTPEEAAEVQSIYVSRMGIISLAGVEYFEHLTKISCFNNQLTSLDVSKNTELGTLDCASNRLTSLDLSANIALTSLNCAKNQLTALNVSKNTALDFLNCSSNQLASLDVSANTALRTIFCESNLLTSIVLGENTKLEYLNCSDNRLASLNVSANTSLTTLHCQNNQLTTLDVNANTALTSLSCQNNQLTSLNLGVNTVLTSLYCQSNQLTSLDVSANTALKNLYCYDNDLIGLNISKMALDDNYDLRCGSQHYTTISKGALMLTLRRNQEAYWNSNLKDLAENTVIVLSIID